jgi:hypothetical protein
MKTALFDSGVLKLDVATIKRAPMKPSRHGMIDYSDFPFKITINEDSDYGRQKVAMVHELVHAGDRLHKWNLDEVRVHDIARFILSEIIPNITRYDQLFKEK